MDGLERELDDVHSRLDFAERVLAEARAARVLPPGGVPDPSPSAGRVVTPH